MKFLLLFGWVCVWLLTAVRVSNEIRSDASSSGHTTRQSNLLFAVSFMLFVLLFPAWALSFSLLSNNFGATGFFISFFVVPALWFVALLRTHYIAKKPAQQGIYGSLPTSPD